MALNTVDELRVIMDSDLSDSQLERFLADANVIIQNFLTASCYTDKKAIEKYLAAHFATVLEPNFKSESISGDYTVQITGQFGELLKSTQYGQMALLLDCKGVLSNLGKQAMSFEVISEYD